MSCGGILHLCQMNDLIAEGAAQFRGRPKVDSPAKSLTELDLHPRHRDVPDPCSILKLDQNVDIAFGTKPVSEHGSEKRELANLVSLAEFSNELRIKLNLRGHDSAFYRARSGDRMAIVGSLKPKHLVKQT